MRVLNDIDEEIMKETKYPKKMVLILSSCQSMLMLFHCGAQLDIKSSRSFQRLL